MREFAMVIKGARLVDPANQVDGLMDLGIREGRIAAVEEDLDTGRASIVVGLQGRVMIPGVIDPHAHFLNPLLGPRPQRMMAKEGVVTAVDMAGGPLEGRMEEVFTSLPVNGAGMNVGVMANARAYLPSHMERNPSRHALMKSALKAVDSGAIGVKIVGSFLTPEAAKTMVEVANTMKIHVTHHCGTSANADQPAFHAFRDTVDMVSDNDLHLHIAHIQHYCRGEVRRPLEEALDALSMLEGGKERIVSDSLLSPYNSCSGECSADKPVDPQTRMCLRLRHYATTREGLEKAIRDGYASVQLSVGESDTLLLTGRDADRHWRENDTKTRLCFPVNAPEATFQLAIGKDPRGRFVVDAISTDGGVTPKNVQVRSGLALVRYGAMTLGELVQKTSYNASRMFGMLNKGHLGVGADADITVLDLSKGEAVMSLASGKVIVVEGQIVGHGGTILTTQHGEERVKASGIPYQLIDSEKSTLYTRSPS
jgi:hypothetical protein